MKRILILGGCGFVGRHFANRFMRDFWHVTVVDDMSAGIEPIEWGFIEPRGYAWWGEHDEFVFHRGDLRGDTGWLNRCELQQPFDLVIHCAAIVGGRLKIEGDPLAVATDLAIDSDFFNWCVKAKPKKIIYFSSSAVYPIELQTRHNHVALAEQFTHFDCSRIGRPDLTYGWAKLTGEYLAKQAVEKYGLDVLVYRPFSGYGEDQSLDYPFPSIIRRVVEGADPITIWGSGDQVRDFIHIDDIVECVLQTMNELEPGEVLNLGSGVPISFRQLAAIAHTEVGPPTSSCNIVTDTSKPEGVFWRVADTYKMSQFYSPKVSLEEGIRRVAAHLTKTAK